MKPISIDAYKLLHDSSLVFGKAERAGLRVDLDYCRRMQGHLERQISYLDNQLLTSNLGKLGSSIYGRTLNFNSDVQLTRLLFEEMHLDVTEFTESGKPSVNATALEAIANDVPEIEHLLRRRKLDKAKGTYLVNFINASVDGFIHPFFNLNNVVTYRSSSDSPNFQNIPKRDPEIQKICRKAIVPRRGRRLCCIDFSGVEVRVAACVTGDTKIETIAGAKTILEVIRDVRSGKDVLVYDYSFNKGRISVNKVLSGGVTSWNAPIWKVTLDNGAIVKATADHNFLLRNGEYTPLSNLKVGDSLMPFYKKKIVSNWGTVYSEVYLNNGQRMMAHNLIALDVFNEDIGGAGKKVVHHIDGNGTNNSLTNIKIVTRKEHMRIHSLQGWKHERSKNGTRHRNVEGLKKANAARKDTWTAQDWFEFSKRVSDGIKRKGGFSGDRNPMFGREHSKETKEKISKTKTGVKSGSAWNTGLTRETDARVAKISETKKGVPSWNAGVSGVYKTSDETKKKLSRALMGRTFSEEAKKKLSNKRKAAWDCIKENGGVTCKVCGRHFSALVTNTHLATHNLTCEDYKNTYNHKVVSIEYCGESPVYNINVENDHNYALSAGVIIKNCYHHDPTMMTYIKDPTTDMHRDMAQEIYLIDKKMMADLNKNAHKVYKAIRHLGKNEFVFPEFYGDWYKSCAWNLWHSSKKEVHRLPDGRLLSDHLHDKGLTTLDEFESHMKRVERNFWYKRFPVYTEWKDQWWDAYQLQGYFDTLTGFRCQGVMDRKQAINYPIQGSAFHCTLASMIDIDRHITEHGLETLIVGQIHDEVVLDLVPEEQDELLVVIHEIMTTRLREKWPWLAVPVEVEISLTEIDGTWYDKSEFSLAA